MMTPRVYVLLHIVSSSGYRTEELGQSISSPSGC